MERIRVATLQYFVRPISDYGQFEDQVSGLVRTAADYECRLLVFPEYFTVQLLTLEDVNRPMDDQVRDLARRVPQFIETFSQLARQTGLYIVAGTIPVADPERPDVIYNDALFFAPDGTWDSQGKLHMTNFERKVWRVSPRKRLRVFETEFGRVAIAICYDVEFPELARAAAREGAVILVAPSYTDDRQGFLRVRYCAHARAVENQMYVVNAATVGSLPMVPAVSLNYGQASILTPSDFPFARDGILAEGVPNQESMVIGELNLRSVRSSRVSGTVNPLRDSKNSAQLVSSVDLVSLPIPSSDPAAAPVPARPRRRVVVRHMNRDDFPGVIELAKLTYPDIQPWQPSQLESHVNVFPEGQFVAVEQSTGLVVGTCSGLIIDWDRYDAGQSWATFTANGSYTNHDPVKGMTLFAADVMVRPGMQGRGLGKRLYEKGRFGIVRRLGLKRVLAGARLRGYHRYAQRMSPEEYVVEVVNGRLNDPTLSFQLSQGFTVLHVASDYFSGDPESLGFAAVIEWLNPEVATPEDYGQGDPRFVPES